MEEETSMEFLFIVFILFVFIMVLATDKELEGGSGIILLLSVLLVLSLVFYVTNGFRLG